ncbi:MAG: hypothetical protein Q9160_008523 [Pyrenula sp. 1 TL-2023]
MSPNASTANVKRSARYGRYFGKPPRPPPKDERFDPRFKSVQGIVCTRIDPTVHVTQSSETFTAKSAARRNAATTNVTTQRASGCSQSALKPEPWTRRLARKDIYEILWYAIAVIFPMTAFSAILLGLVYGYRIDSKAANQNIDRWENSSHRLHDSYIYVHYSATQLMFITSWSSSTAPVLIPFLMKLWHIEVSRDIMEASSSSEQEKLTTPFQLSLIINMSTGALSELFFYIKYLFWKRKAKSPAVFIKTALVLVLAGLLYSAIFAADTVLHYKTPTVQHRAYLPAIAPKFRHSFSRGLIDECLNFNRSDNFLYPGAWPCTWLAHERAPGEVPTSDSFGKFRNEFEVNSLKNNRSRQHDVVPMKANGLYNGDLQLLLPKLQNLPSHFNFVANTVGASTQCLPMTKKCSIRFPGYGSLRYFNCSSAFVDTSHTLLAGKGEAFAPFISEPNEIRIEGGYFANANMTQFYVSKGFVGIRDSDEVPILPDSALINPLYTAVLGAFKPSKTSGNGLLLQELEAVASPGDSQFINVALNCTFSTYDVQIRWSNNSLSLSSYNLTRNGSIAELYHAVFQQFSDDFLQAWRLASLQNTSQAFMREYANAHSNLALAAIGSVMKPRPTLEEVAWKDVLVTKVPVFALWFLVAANMSFALMALVLAIRAIKASSSPDLKDLVTKIGVAGMTAASLEDCPLVDGKGPVMSEEELFEESQIGDGSRRIGAYPNGRGGFHIVTFR